MHTHAPLAQRHEPSTYVIQTIAHGRGNRVGNLIGNVHLHTPRTQRHAQAGASEVGIPHANAPVPPYGRECHQPRPRPCVRWEPRQRRRSAQLATNHRTGRRYIHVLMDLTQRRSAGLHPSQDLPVHAAGTNFRRRQPMSTPHHHATSPHAARYVSFNVLSTPNGQLHRLQVEACGLQLVDLPLQ